MGTVSFPGLGLEFHLNRVAFHIGSWPVYWYGIIIAAGFLLAVLYCCHAAKRFGIKQDDIIDMLFFAVPLSIVGARLYSCWCSARCGRSDFWPLQTWGCSVCSSAR